METILEMYGPVPSGGDVGIEIEVEGKNLPVRGFDVWQAKRDGSLKGEGYEYVTKGAVKLENLDKAMINLNKRFEAAEAFVNDAHRASVHIHVNAQNYTLYQVFGMLFAWAMAERVWMRLCGATRESNLFCLPSSQTGHQIQFAKELLTCIANESFHALPVKGKYDALNTDPIMNLGSVEFRTFPSSINTGKICEWAGWCTRLVSYGAKIDRDNLTKEWKKVFENPEAFLDAIFKGSEKSLVKDEAIELVKKGCEDASDLCLVWANHKIDLAKKKLEIKPVQNYFKFKAPRHPDGLNEWARIMADERRAAALGALNIDDELRRRGE